MVELTRRTFLAGSAAVAAAPALPAIPAAVEPVTLPPVAVEMHAYGWRAMSVPVKVTAEARAAIRRLVAEVEADMVRRVMES